LAARSPKTPWSGSMSLPTRSDFQTAMKGDRLRPLRSAQAVAVHQDGIGGRGHPVERCRFFPDQAKFGAVRRRHGLRPRRSGPRRLDAGRRAVRKLRGRPDPSRAFGGIKGATTRSTAPAYWKFESSPLQRRVRLSTRISLPRSRSAAFRASVRAMAGSAFGRDRHRPATWHHW
jgi:hypothetical protein